jgi:GT2 family glycosyltransferase
MASVVIPVWNGMQDLPACLAALMAQEGLSFEVIVVDNASTDGSAEYVAAHYPQITLVRNAVNQGFAGGCNTGLRQARGDVLALLNQDTEVRPDWLARLAAVLHGDPAIGIAGCKTFFADGTLQHAGGYIDSRGLSIHAGHQEADRGQYDYLREVDFVTGAALAITRAVYEAVGDLDEGFGRGYYEDADWCYRARRAGYRVVYAPDAILVHKERAAALVPSHDGLYLLHRNRLRFVLKHWPLRQLVEEFMPAERRWLNQVTHDAVRQIAAVHHAYLAQLLYLGDLVEARTRLLGGAPEQMADSGRTLNEVEGLAYVLLTLRGVYPLRPANLENMADRSTLETGAQRDARAEVAGWGPLAGFALYVRRRWPSLSIAPLTRRLARLTNQQQLAETLVEYIRENNREIMDLAQEIERLRRRLDRER